MATPKNEDDIRWKAVVAKDKGAGGQFFYSVFSREWRALRPRRQSKVEVLRLRQGDLAIFALRDRPANGVRGIYRVMHRHGQPRPPRKATLCRRHMDAGTVCRPILLV